MFHGTDAGGRHGSKRLTGAILLLALAGCVTLSGTRIDPEEMKKESPRLQHTLEPAAVPDLRIPVDQVADSREIPLVPVPPVPISSGARQQAGAIKPVSAQMPVPEPQATPPAPLAVHETPVPDAPPAPATPPPVVESAPPCTARQLYERAAARYAGIDSYIARLIRREQVKKKNNPEEVMLFKFRKNPWSVHFKWLGEVGHGREVIYVKDRFENKIHTLLAAGDAPFMPAGKRIDLAPDSPLVRSASRHSITEAGIGSSLESMGQTLALQERGDFRRGKLEPLPLQNRPEYPQPVQAIEHTIPPGSEPELPQGGRRLICFDPEWQMPLLVITRDHQGQEVEYYRYDRLETPVNLDEDDFNPDRLWSSANNKTPK